jgi:hypothetical protein
MIALLIALFKVKRSPAGCPLLEAALAEKSNLEL